MSFEEIQSEVEALQAIFCGPNEFEMRQNFHDNRDTIFTIHLTSESCRNKISVTYTLGDGYPNGCPGISILCDRLGRDACNTIREDTIKHVKENALMSQPMIMDICLWLQQNMDGYFKSIETSSSVTENTAVGDIEDALWQGLLHLDHMRSRTKYVKTIEKWTSELGLMGHLIFSDKLILILLQGTQKNIKEYLKLQKTVNVDVDSKGRSCKERMLTVLSLKPTDKECIRFTEFCVLEVQPNKLKDTFYNWSLAELFHSSLVDILHR